jgi:uncharacterized protein (TIGR03118 family)
VKRSLRILASPLLTLSMGAAALGQHYSQVNLVANTSGIAPSTDAQLATAWGLARSSSSAWWVSDNNSGVSTLYNGKGEKQSLVVTIPKVDPNNKTFPAGTPTGVIFNGSSTEFLLSAGNAATFIFSTLDGAIVGWNANVGIAQGASAPSTHALVVATGEAGSEYTGLTSASIDGKTYLYAANFSKGRVDVFDTSFKAVKLGRELGKSIFRDEDEPVFADPLLPRDFVPFNVKAIGDNIVVTYAFRQEGQPQETDGPGLGFVDIYDTQGRLLQRLESGDQLNAPWGIALAPLDFGRFSHDLLIGQFSGAGDTENSGRIAAFNLTTGKFDGFLEDATGQPISIKGLWSISPANNAAPGSYDPAGAPESELYFTAGHSGTGLFGYLKPVPTELTAGDDQ